MKDWSTDPRPGYLVNRASRLFRNFSNGRLKEMGLGDGQVPVLMTLSDGEPATQKELAKKAGVEQPTMAQMLARMERDDLIERWADPEDGRSSLVQLTRQAMDHIPAVIMTLQAANEVALRGFSEAESRQLTELLGRAVANLEAEGG